MPEKEINQISYQSPMFPSENRIHYGAKNKRIPAQKFHSNSFKKKNRKAFTTNKKKLGNNTSEVNECGMLIFLFMEFVLSY